MDSQIQYLPVYTSVYIVGLKEDCGVGLVEGTVLCGTKYLRAVRFSPPLTLKGREYLSNQILLTPNGKLSRIYCLPSQDLIPVGSHKLETSNARRKKRKA